MERTGGGYPEKGGGNRDFKVEGSGRSREKSTQTLRNILQSRKLKALGGNTFEAETLFKGHGK